MQITLSNKTFWKWIDGLIRNDFDLFDRMIRIDRYATSEEYRRRVDTAQSSMFLKLKKSMPVSYFHEMEYCALAYSVVFGKVFPPLTQHIEQLAYIEWLHYVEPAQKNYRDHFVHMLKVAFVAEQVFLTSLGQRIIDCQFNSKHFAKWIEEEKIFLGDDKKHIVQAAIFLSAILHDFGYGYKFIRGYEERLFSLNLLGSDSIDITKSQNEIIKRSLLARYIQDHHEWFHNTEDKLQTRQRKNSVSCGFIRDCLPLNHSVSSALMALSIAERLFRSQIITSDLYVAFQIAAEACLLHDLTSPHKYLHFSDAPNDHKHFLDSNCHSKIPVSKLLIFADEMSMWSRPLINFQPEGFKEVRGQLTSNWKGTSYPEIIIINIDDSQQRLEVELENDLQKAYLSDILRNCNCFTAGTGTDLGIFDYKIYLN